jgi:hypothetical protein
VESLDLAGVDEELGKGEKEESRCIAGEGAGLAREEGFESEVAKGDGFETGEKTPNVEERGRKPALAEEGAGLEGSVRAGDSAVEEKDGKKVSGRRGTFSKVYRDRERRTCPCPAAIRLPALHRRLSFPSRLAPSP